MIESRNHFQESRRCRQGGFCYNKNTSCSTKKQKAFNIFWGNDETPPRSSNNSRLRKRRGFFVCQPHLLKALDFLSVKPHELCDLFDRNARCLHVFGNCFFFFVGLFSCPFDAVFDAVLSCEFYRFHIYCPSC